MASGVAITGAVYYARLGPSRASSVPAMELAMTISAVVVLAAAALTLLLPRRARTQSPPAAEEPAAEEPAAEEPAAEEPAAEVSAGAAH